MRLNDTQEQLGDFPSSEKARKEEKKDDVLQELPSVKKLAASLSTKTSTRRSLTVKAPTRDLSKIVHDGDYFGGKVVAEAIQLHKSDPKTFFREIWGLVMLIPMGMYLYLFCVLRHVPDDTIPTHYQSKCVRSLCPSGDAISNRFSATTFGYNVPRIL